MKKIAIMCAPFVLLLACGPSTNITNSWNASNAQAHPLHKVVVVALISGQDRSLREKMEQQLSSALSSEGYATTAATAQYGPKAFEGIKEGQAIRKLRSAGVDGVVTITLLDKDQEQNYVPGRVQYYPAAVTYNRFWGYYSTYYNRVYSPGYYTNTTKYFIETNLYDIKSNRLIYSAQSETYDPSSVQSLASDYSKAIVKDMKQKDLLQSSSGK